MDSDSNKLPHLDFPGEFLLGNDVDITFLSPYMSFPCKTKAAVLVLCLSGEADISIFLHEYAIKANDFLIVLPGSVIQLHEVSDNTKICFMALSSHFVETYHFVKKMSVLGDEVYRYPIVRFDNAEMEIFRDLFTSLTRLNDKDSSFSSTSVLQASVDLILSLFFKSYKVQVPDTIEPVSRDREIFGDFMQLAFEYYPKHHNADFYAGRIGLSKSHFCSVIRRVSGKTVQSIINGLLILDAKSQLKRSNLPVCKIGMALGFYNPTTFSRYFLKYVGKTPLEYRKNG